MAHEFFVSVGPRQDSDFHDPVNPFSPAIQVGETALVRNSGRVWIEFHVTGPDPVDVTIATRDRQIGPVTRPGPFVPSGSIVFRVLEVEDRVIEVAGDRPAPTGPFPVDLYGEILRITASVPGVLSMRVFAR